MKPTQEKIFKTAIELFSQKGYNGVSIREIARAVGIKESSLYNHFQNKDDLLEKIFDYYQTEMDKTSLSEEYLDKKISNLPAQKFWEKGLINFQKKTQDPLMQKISKIILLEMFRDERARNIALNEFFSRQQKTVEIIFGLMQKKGLIKKSIDPKLLAVEYAYGMLAIQFEFNLLNNWNLNTDKARKIMLNHIKFISDYAKSINGGENK